MLLRGDQLLGAYAISLGASPVGPKLEEGDGRTPEGEYVLDWRLDAPQSDYYRAIHVSYPNHEDRRRADEAGVSPGGGIMIHGLPAGLGAIGEDHLEADWTRGCIAVTNEEMDEIWARVQDGTPIEIRP